MNDKIKNIVTNVLGLLMVIASVYGLLTSLLTLASFGVLILISLSLFMFKMPILKSYIQKFLDKKLK